MNEIARGSIRLEEAYAQGKMLDHSSWLIGDRKLPRNVRPSDIDIVFSPGSEPGQHYFSMDDRAHGGAIIFCELTRQFPNWENIRFAQRWHYEAAIAQRPHCAVVCRHAVPTNQIIDTRKDIIGFQVMIFDFGFVRWTPQTSNNNEGWQNFVFGWFKNPQTVRRALLGFSVGLINRKVGK